MSGRATPRLPLWQGSQEFQSAVERIEGLYRRALAVIVVCVLVIMLLLSTVVCLWFRLEEGRCGMNGTNGTDGRGKGQEIHAEARSSRRGRG